MDFETYDLGLFQTVVQYMTDERNDRIIIIAPRAAYLERKTEIKELQIPPRFNYGEKVVPSNHLDMVGVIIKIGWHFKLECCFYIIKVGKKVKSKRYFENDLISYN